MSVDGLRTGERLGKYRLERLLGKGAMGSVFLATDVLLGRQVALKTIATMYAGDPQFKARFLREARTLARVNHPHVVQIYDVHDPADDASSSSGRFPFLVTEFVDGMDLHTIIRKEGALAWRRAALISRQTALGLAAAAARDIVHRDVKPGNILVSGEVAKVTDFGLAKPLIGDQSLTQAEVVMGTPDYMAPEQAMGQQIDWRADLYSLGCTLFQSLTGRTPYGSGAPAQICSCHVYEPFPSVAELTDNLPTGLVALLNQLVEKDPTRRPKSYEAVVDTFDRLLGPTREAGKPAAFVIVESGRQLGRRTIVGSRPMTIGRLPDCELAIDDARASRRHAVIQPCPSGIEVRDLGSRNGIFVNDRRAEQALLKTGDRITIGNTVIRFEVPADSLAPRRRSTDASPPSPPQPEALVSAPAAERSMGASQDELLSLLTRAMSESRVSLLAVDENCDLEELVQYRCNEGVVVCVSLRGTSPLLSEMSPIEVGELLDHSVGALIRAFFAHGGSIVALAADTILASFGTPLPVPDSAGRAAIATLEGVAAVSAFQAHRAARQRVHVQAGIAAGSVLTGIWGDASRRQIGAVGTAIDLARHLSTTAPSGGVLVTGEVHALLGEQRAAAPRPDLTLRVGAQPVTVYELNAQPVGSTSR